jgi:hypothetical protein
VPCGLDKLAPSHSHAATETTATSTTGNRDCSTSGRSDCSTSVDSDCTYVVGGSADGSDAWTDSEDGDSNIERSSSSSSSIAVICNDAELAADDNNKENEMAAASGPACLRPQHDLQLKLGWQVGQHHKPVQDQRFQAGTHSQGQNQEQRRKQVRKQKQDQYPEQEQKKALKLTGSVTRICGFKFGFIRTDAWWV